MPFESDGGDLQKLNIIVQFVFLSLNSLYVVPLFLTFHKLCSSFLVHPMVQKMLKLMKNWTSYTLWKWRGWFAKIERNNLVCVFEFKLFVHCSITLDIFLIFVILLLAHPILKKFLNLIKIWERYVHWKWSGVI
jgi:hypothetical protein